MTTNTHNGSWSHRLGRGAGRAWRGYLRREQRVAGWLVTRGVLPSEQLDEARRARDTSAAQCSGNTRGRFSVMPPPVMWAIPFTNPA